jgi:hypothetical protein
MVVFSFGICSAKIRLCSIPAIHCSTHLANSSFPSASGILGSISVVIIIILSVRQGGGDWRIYQFETTIVQWRISVTWWGVECRRHRPWPRSAPSSVVARFAPDAFGAMPDGLIHCRRTPTATSCPPPSESSKWAQGSPPEVAKFNDDTLKPAGSIGVRYIWELPSVLA